MGYALLFYRALTGINVPSDQAAAVVQALEQSMSSELTTKADLAVTKSELKAEMSELRTELKAEMSELRAELKAEMSELRAELKAEMSDLRAELKAEMSELRADMVALENRLTLRLGAMMVAVAGLLFAALQLT